MHHPELQKLEGSWRGLNYLVMNSETSSTLKIRMISITKKELHKDLSKAVEFDQSQIFKKCTNLNLVALVVNRMVL